MSSSVLRRSQIAPEAVVGTAVAPTRQLAGVPGLTLTDAPDRQLREEARASMFGPTTYDDMTYSSSGSYAGRLVYNEVPFFLLSSIRGDVVPTTPAGSAKLWTVTQPSTIVALKSVTAYAGDNTKALRAAGVFTNRLEFACQDTGWWRIAAGLIGRQLVVDDADASTFAFDTALTTPVSEAPKSKKNILYIDDSGGTIGTTLKANTAWGARWVFDPKITAAFPWNAGALDMEDIQRAIPEATLEITATWNAIAVAEFKKRRDLATRLIRIENTGSLITGSTFNRIRVDGAYQYTGFDPLDSERDGTQLGRLMLTAVEDQTWAKKTEVSVQCTLTAADLPIV